MSKKITLAVLALIILAVLVFLYTRLPNDDSMALKTSPKPSTTSASSSAQLKIEDTKQGSGVAVKSGDTVVMNYTGTLEDGTKFDSSLDRGQPFETKIGTGEVIKGWDQGIPGMKVGGKRRLTIPPELGYGAEGSPPKIPPNSTLIFDVELLQIK